MTPLGRYIIAIVDRASTRCGLEMFCLFVFQFLLTEINDEAHALKQAPFSTHQHGKFM